MGGRSYYYGGRRINSSRPECPAWFLGLFVSGVFGFTLFYIATTIYELNVNMIVPPDDILLGLSETRLIPTHPMWVSYFGGGNVLVIDRTPTITNKKPHTPSTNESTEVKLMKFSKIPPLTQVDFWTSKIRAEIEPNDYYYWSWYFHRGTKITIEWKFYGNEQTEQKIDTYLVKSEEGFDAFDKWTESSTVTSLFRKPYRYIYEYTTNNKLEYEVFRDDFHFIFFWNNNKQSVQGYFEYTIESTLYDVSEPDESCALPCYFPVTNHNDVFVLVSPRASAFPSSAYSINTDFAFTPQYSLRWYLISVFLFTPTCIYLIGLVFWYPLKYMYDRQMLPH